MYNCLVTGGIARSTCRRYLIYSEANFEAFCPAGVTRCTDGGEIWHGGRDRRFVVVQPCSSLSDCCQLATTLNAEVQKTAKLGFFANRGRQINRSRRNLARKRIPSAIAHQIWPSSVKGDRYRSSQKVNICPTLWFLATGSRHNEHIQMKFGL